MREDIRVSFGSRGDVKLMLFGTKKQTEKFHMGNPTERLVGIEEKDRLYLQEYLDQTGMPDVSYEGNTVYPKKKLVNELKKVSRSGDISKMSDRLYKFLSLNVDIAHYDKNGFISHYGETFGPMFHAEARNILSYRYNRFTDVRQIFIESGLMELAEMAI